MSYVYIAYAPDLMRSKIGKSVDPDQRVASISAGAPCKVEIWYSIRCKNSSKLESLLHNFFCSDRIKGEWFEITPDEILTKLGVDSEAQITIKLLENMLKDSLGVKDNSYRDFYIPSSGKSCFYENRLLNDDVIKYEASTYEILVDISMGIYRHYFNEVINKYVFIERYGDVFSKLVLSEEELKDELTKNLYLEESAA